jgi:hypothetical protein
MEYLARSTSSSQIDQHSTYPIQEMENIPSNQIKKTKLGRAKKTCLEKKQMDYKQLEDAMDKMARGITTFEGASKFFNIPLTSLSKKVDPHNVLLKKEEVIIVD